MRGERTPEPLSFPALRPGRCPWCCRRHSKHKRLTFCPCGSCGRPPNVKQNVAPYPTFNTNNYPGPSSLSPSRRLQADCSSKSFCFFSSSPSSLISVSFKMRSGRSGDEDWGEENVGGGEEGEEKKEKGRKKKVQEDGAQREGRSEWD